MAQRRMINTKISLSEQVDNLSNWGQLFYTWSILHADDIGLLPREAKFLKAKVFPLKDLTFSNIESFIKEIIKNGLYEEVVVNGKTYLRIINFSLYQQLRRDMNPEVIFEYEKVSKTSKISQSQVYKANWEKVEKVESNWIPSCNSSVTDTEQVSNEPVNNLYAEEKRREEKRREEKRREEKRREPPKSPSKKTPKKPKKKIVKHKYGEYKNVLLSDDQKEKLKSLHGNQKAKKLVKNLDEYIETSGKSYKNHYLVIVKWESKDKNQSNGKEYGKSVPAQVLDRERKQAKQAQYDQESKDRDEAAKNNDNLRKIEEMKKKLKI